MCCTRFYWKYGVTSWCFFLLVQLCLDGISFFFRLKQDVLNCLETGQTTRGFCLYNKFFGFLGPKLLHRHQAPSHSIEIWLRFVLGSEKDNKKWTQAIWDPKHQQLIWLEPQNKATYTPKRFFPFHRIVNNKSSKSLCFPWQKQHVHSLNEFISQVAAGGNLWSAVLQAINGDTRHEFNAVDICWIVESESRVDSSGTAMYLSILKVSSTQPLRLTHWSVGFAIRCVHCLVRYIQEQRKIPDSMQTFVFQIQTYLVPVFEV